MTSVITDALFVTEALKICPENQPFWYTSGLFGPYYINTHFLFGSEAEAKTLLQFIEKMAEKENREFLCKELATICKIQYEKSEIYRSVIDAAVAAVKDVVCDFISGGERRDYFFSVEIARQLNKPHLTLFKDNQAWFSSAVTENAIRMDDRESRKTTEFEHNPKSFSEMAESDFYSEEKADIAESDLNLGRALHIADLITEASSYTRNWIGSVAASGGKITETLAIVDRCQGGIEILAQQGIKATTLVQISPVLFADARNKNLISHAQEKLLLDYYADPHQFVRNFLEKNPQYLDQQAKLDPKTAERVERLRNMKL